MLLSFLDLWWQCSLNCFHLLLAILVLLYLLHQLHWRLLYKVYWHHLRVRLASMITICDNVLLDIQLLRLYGRLLLGHLTGAFLQMLTATKQVAHLLQHRLFCLWIHVT